MLTSIGGTTAWDVGANVGVYSAMAADAGYRVIAWDQDAGSVEEHWRRVRGDARPEILPLILDLADPSPSIGWGLRERASFLERGEPELILALALVHHLAIGNNVPLPGVAELFARMAPSAIVEFVPKEDPMKQRLLAARRDVFEGYTIEGFRTRIRCGLRDRARGRVNDSPRTSSCFGVGHNRLVTDAVAADSVR